jgi:hypothetical protein
MPYETGIVIIGLALAVVFATFAYALVNARTMMALFRPISDDEIVAGPGKRGSKKLAFAMLFLHFGAWAVAGLTWLYMLADTRASASDSTPLENAGVVDGVPDSD